MFLNHKERVERNTVNKNLDDSCMMICKKCKGTGLSGLIYQETIKSYSWDGISYCDKCRGFGKFEWIDFIKKGRGLNTEDFDYGEK